MVAVLAGERTALDFVMVLSGIATEAPRWQQAAGPARRRVRHAQDVAGAAGALEVRGAAWAAGPTTGLGLWDMVLVKDNHIRAAGGIAEAVASARDRAPRARWSRSRPTRSRLRSRRREAGADIVLLDNMDDAALAEAVAAVSAVAARRGRRVLTEASGGITYERLASLRAHRCRSRLVQRAHACAAHRLRIG